MVAELFIDEPGEWASAVLFVCFLSLRDSPETLSARGDFFPRLKKNTKLSLPPGL